MEIASDAKFQRRTQRRERLRNLTCPYCARSFCPSLRSTLDHVIGRRFVPKGTLGGGWNLFLNACRDCNLLKGCLEDAISAASMHVADFKPDRETDRVLREETLRKSNGSVGRRADRQPQTLQIGGQFMPGVKMSFSIVGPPSARRDQVALLARLQAAAFFHLVTYTPDNQLGRYWVGDYVMVNWAGRTDWGNDRQIAFMKLVQSWEPVVALDTANGFFRAAMRRDQVSGQLFSWAVEWNTNYRVVGLIGDCDKVNEREKQLPTLEERPLAESPEESIRFRINRPLNPQDDTLFEWPAVLNQEA